jgi:hypothetical protein
MIENPATPETLAFLVWFEDNSLAPPYLRNRLAVVDIPEDFKWLIRTYDAVRKYRNVTRLFAEAFREPGDWVYLETYLVDQWGIYCKSNEIHPELPCPATYELFDFLWWFDHMCPGFPGNFTEDLLSVGLSETATKEVVDSIATPYQNRNAVMLYRKFGDTPHWGFIQLLLHRYWRECQAINAKHRKLPVTDGRNPGT